MNFFAARLAREGEQASVTVGAGQDAQRLTLAGAVAERLAGQASGSGREVVLGIRPEDLRAGDGGAGRTLVGRVDVVEHLGNEQLVHLQVPGVLVPEGAEARAVTARVGPDVLVRPNDRMPLTVDMARVHVFDPQTTNAFV
jgi:multiple sugar transport system ATP-binding protein